MKVVPSGVRLCTEAIGCRVAVDQATVSWTVERMKIMIIIRRFQQRVLSGDESGLAGC
jgi:hypothetical protein